MSLLSVVMVSSFHFSVYSDYFPASEKEGGWRKNTHPDFLRSLSLDFAKLEKFRQYNMSLDSHSGKKG